MKLSRHMISVSTALATCVFVLSVGTSAAAAHRVSPHPRIYKGTGTVTALDGESDVFTVNFTSTNRAQRARRRSQ
jgi:hypothetical protein